MRPLTPSGSPILALKILWHSLHSSSYDDSLGNEKLDGLVGVGSADNSGGVPVDEAREGVDGDVFEDQEKLEVESDVGVPWRLCLGHAVISVVTTRLPWLVYDVGIRSARSQLMFNQLW